jgi:hypothetical protein
MAHDLAKNRPLKSEEGYTGNKLLHTLETRSKPCRLDRRSYGADGHRTLAWFGRARAFERQCLRRANSSSCPITGPGMEARLPLTSPL